MSLTPSRMVIILIKKKQKTTRVGKEVEKLEPSSVAGGNVKWSSHCGKQVSSYSIS